MKFNINTAAYYYQEHLEQKEKSVLRFQKRVGFERSSCETTQQT